jgi:hypothetical protein
VIRVVVDVNLSAQWVDVFVNRGWPAVHWSTVGDPRAKDPTVMAWARETGGSTWNPRQAGLPTAALSDRALTALSAVASQQRQNS